MGRTVDGKLYCWGSNRNGVLGNGRSDGTFNKPEVNEPLKDKHIIEMSCGDAHSLVLTNEGEVYGWGWNTYGQIGNRNIGYYESQLIPYLVNEFNGRKVISISCGGLHSLALTENGSVYSWGRNEYGELGRNTGEDGESSIPKAIELNEEIIIEKICCGWSHSLLLSREGDIYWFGECRRYEQLVPIKVNKSIKFKDIAALWYFKFSCALSTNDVYYVFGDIFEDPTETEFKSFNEMFIFYKGITYNTIEGKLSVFNDDFIRQGFYEKEFFDCKEIGRGSYGKVFEVKELNYNKEEKHYAIKKIELNFSEQKNIPKELENYSVIKELRNTKLVETYDLWFENEITNNVNVAVPKPLKRYVYIKMELCDKTLKELIEEIKNGQLIQDNCLTLLGYYTCCNIFIQILEGVNYLHTRKSPIIHRDLTPYNILIKFNNHNKCIVKIADLGLACLHIHKDQQHTEDRGNTNYAAPEALNSSHYDTRADIFSLGVILKELFLIDINRDYTEDDESSLMNKYQELSELYDKMTQQKVNKRLKSCQQILNERTLWGLMDNEFNINKQFKEFFDNCDEQYKKSYVYKLIELMFIKSKLSKFNDNFIRQGFYEKEFFDCKEIGKGSYGTVFEVKQLNYRKEEHFAIKRIELNFSEPNKEYFNETILKELENYSVIKQLRNKKLVETYDLWFENEVTNNINVAAPKLLKRYVYIKMELCDKTLNELIEEIKNDVQLFHDNCLTLLGYYTCCNIFIQILEGVNYLHTRKPSIIHRDLTPYNILIKMNEKTNSIVKIADLGLTCLHNYKDQQTDDRGNMSYAASEALNSSNYDTRADIFSLGVILKELFLIDINRDYTENDKSNKYQKLIKLCDKMTRNIVSQRPQSCQQILNDKNSWALMDNEFNINKELKQFSDNCDEEYKSRYVYKVIESMTKNNTF